jgi:hypothetical protein
VTQLVGQHRPQLTDPRHREQPHPDPGRGRPAPRQPGHERGDPGDEEDPGGGPGADRCRRRPHLGPDGGLGARVEVDPDIGQVGRVVAQHESGGDERGHDQQPGHPGPGRDPETALAPARDDHGEAPGGQGGAAELEEAEHGQRGGRPERGGR